MSSGPVRLASGGHIDRAAPLSFSLESRALSGFRGDSLASALLAAGITLVGRSFKYHRPRGFLAAGVEEPNGLFTLGHGGRTTPNIAGTTAELHAGLTAARQNGWPSVDFDVMAVNSLAGRLLSAGFYYKTFMGPRRGSWMFYEPFIRRAAGLGRAVHQRDPDRYETRNAHADVAIVGGGPAGLAAALVAGRSGARVMLIEQDWLLGGSLLGTRSGPAEQWRQQTEAELSLLPNVEILRRTTALGLYDGNTLALVEHRDALTPDPARGEAREIAITLRARAIVFASGAFERPLVFPDNDRPGVMLASAVRTYLNRYAVRAGERALIVTNNNSAHAVALDLAACGASVTLADQRTALDDATRLELEKAGVRLFLGAAPIAVDGKRSVRGARLRIAGSSRTVDVGCDVIGMSGGWSPVVHLTSHTGIKPIYREDIDAFVPGAYATGHFGAGALDGVYGLADSIRDGADAGRRAAQHVGHPTDAVCPVPDVAEPAYQQVPAGPSARGKAFIDFQNDVTTADLDIANQEGFVSVEHLKRYTTLGMGTDQGKTSNANAIQLMAGLRDLAIPAAGTTTFRPPYTPVSVGALAGRNVGHHFRPVRRSALHDWHAANGAAFIEAGPWLRAWYYRWAGATAESAYVEEMRLVRSTVGLSDVSTLGKIDVQGPDAAEFLNRVYVNGFAKLPVGKARYGVMLNDDATVLDDGTAARFSETKYFMTTTTAQAAEVMSRLEFLLQTAWPELRVNVTSLTDQWAGMCVAGPKARAVLELALPGVDVSDAALPHMGCRELDLDGVPLRLLRLSFSGELAYELYVPADCGVPLWEHLLATGAPLGIRPYGLEALASLRIEKGHVAGLELDHRTTLDDLGLGKMAGRDKAFVGRELRLRDGLQSPERWSLVGIEGLESDARLRGGAILFAAGEPITGHGRGYITSVTWSVELNKFIALGLYTGGLRHEGTEIICAYPLKGEQVRARIVSPMFIDPAGARLHV